MALSTKPRVLFSNPPWWPGQTASGQWVAGVRAGSRWPFTYAARSRPGVRDLDDYTPAPLFMQHAASYVKRATGARVVLRDSIATRESYVSYFGAIRAMQPDFIFIESASPSWEHDVHVIREVAKTAPAARIAVTGPIATLGEVALGQVSAVAMIKGEYEKGAVRVIEGARGVLDFDLLTEQEMNVAPFPIFGFYGSTDYWDANPAGQRRPQLQAWSSRGCPYKCIFCVWPAAMTGNDPDGLHKRTVRHYSRDYLSAYMEHVADWQFRSVYFDDDTLNLGERHVLDVCEVMERLALPWSAMCRADGISRLAWRAMRKSGCFGVKLGFESGNQYVVNEIVNKRLDLEAAKDTVAYLHELGMSVHGTFTYGLPGETDEQRADTKRYIRDLLALGMTTYQESGCAEIEGAPLRTLAERGSLEVFPGAHADAGYMPAANGSEKFRILSESGACR